MDSDLIGQSSGALTVATNKFLGVYTLGSGWSTIISGSGQNVMPITGTLKNFYISCDAGPGAAITRTFVVQKNGVDTSLLITLTGAGTGAGISAGNDTNAAHNVSFAPADTLTIRTSASGTTTSAGVVRWSFGLNAAANTSCLLSGSAGAMGITFPVYISPQSANLDLTSGANVEGIMPTAGTIKNAYVALNTAIGAGTDLTFTLYQNGIATSLAIVINTATTIGNDTTHSVTVAAGDRLYWKVTSTVAPATKTSFISMEFDPTVNGESVHMFGGATATSASATRYQTIAQNGSSYSTTEPAREVLSQAATFKKFYLYNQSTLNTTTTTGTLFQNNASTALTASLASVAAGTTVNDSTHNITVAAGDSLGMQIVTGTQTSILEWSLVSLISTAVNASVAQVAATLTLSDGGGTTVTTVQNSTVTQVGAVLTATTGTQAVSTSSIVNTSVTQVGATLTLTGGTQSVATVNDVSISQAAATLTLSGGTQAIASVNYVSISQLAANLTLTGGTQSLASQIDTAISQQAANLTFNGGLQTISNGSGATNISIAQLAASLTLTGGTQIISTATGPLPKSNKSASLIFLTDGRMATKVSNNIYLPL